MVVDIATRHDYEQSIVGTPQIINRRDLAWLEAPFLENNIFVVLAIENYKFKKKKIDFLDVGL